MKRQPPTTNRHRPPTTNCRDRQRRPTTNCQPLPTANNHQSPITNHQTPPTNTIRHQPPVANCQPPIAANRHQPWFSTWNARGLFWEIWFRNNFSFPLRTALGGGGGRFPLHPAYNRGLLLEGGGGFWRGVGWHTLALCIWNCCLVLFNCFDVYKGQGATHHIIWPTLPTSVYYAIPFLLQPHDPCWM